MGSSAPSPSSIASPEFLAAFRAQANATGAMTFAQFMQLALYHPAVGYYRRDRARAHLARARVSFTASTRTSAIRDQGG